MRVLKHIPDVVIASCVIVGAVAFGAGYRVVGGVSMFVAILVGWKRNWCIEAFTELAASGGAAREQGDLADTGAGDAGDDE